MLFCVSVCYSFCHEIVCSLNSWRNTCWTFVWSQSIFEYCITSGDMILTKVFLTWHLCDRRIIMNRVWFYYRLLVVTFASRTATMHFIWLLFHNFTADSELWPLTWVPSQVTFPTSHIPGNEYRNHSVQTSAFIRNLANFIGNRYLLPWKVCNTDQLYTAYDTVSQFLISFSSHFLNFNFLAFLSYSRCLFSMFVYLLYKL